jgi:hypothetical protein
MSVLMAEAAITGTRAAPEIVDALDQLGERGIVSRCAEVVG